MNSLRCNSRNQLLQNLPEAAYQLLSPHIERVELPLRFALEEPHVPIEFVYFLENGLASFVAATEDGISVEVGVLGREGLTGTPLLLDDAESPFHCFMQIPGEGWRIATPLFLAALYQSPQLRRAFSRCARAATIQVAYTALSNGKIPINERLARWLLMVDDRMLSNSFSLTHEFLSEMLGVRRQGVTEALHVLEGKGLIGSTRSMITIRDRQALILFAGSTYGPAELEYKRLTGLALGRGDRK